MSQNNMNKTLNAELHRKYKAILPRNVNIECDDGWYVILTNLFDCIRANIEHNNPKLHLQITCIKEKFGTLRVYYHSDQYDSRVEGMLRMAEAISGSICEVCGSVNGKIRKSVWAKCLCDSCFVKENKA